MESQTRLLGALRSRQRDLGETDQVFAARLGMSRPMWGFLRNGRFDVSMGIARRIVRAFPEFTPLAAALLVPEPEQQEAAEPVARR